VEADATTEWALEGRRGILFGGRQAVGEPLPEEGDESVEIVATSGMPQAEVADLVEAGWKDVLEKTAEELVGVEVHGGPLVSLAVLVAEADSAVIDGEDSAIGDGMPEDVSGKVLQDTFSTMDSGFDEAVPLLRSPWDMSVLRQLFSSHGDELCGENLREGSCGHEE
jgi:hypothetical protein